jgi:hypothetical protein
MKTTDPARTTAEHRRLLEARKNAPWKKWGPYLSERQWGTVREDYSPNGDAWDYFSHDQARSRAYRWGEDGLAGVCDDHQVLCLALALWNGRDPILKERLFGCTNSEGNHGEDVKEYYYYLDSTPTHSYMKYLYKYPQAAYPYDRLVAENRRRGRTELEYELIDTGVFDGDRYFDVFVEYAKASPSDLLVRITAHNRGPEAAELHLLPTLWFRNTWSWPGGGTKPVIRRAGAGVIAAAHTDELFRGSLGNHFLYCGGGPTLLFTENETNAERLFGSPNASPYVKDAFHSLVVGGRADAVNPAMAGTKSAAHYRATVEGGGSALFQLRLCTAPPEAVGDPFGRGFDEAFAARIREADEFYAAVTPPGVGEDAARVIRQALAGMLWSKQYFYFDVNRWLDEHDIDPMSPEGRSFRNKEWFHMVNDDVISMPDKWEYPWYAAWDLAFHTAALSLVDPDFARDQLELMTSAEYLHPSGQIPAYEWNFSDVNPPVHAWACLFLANMEKLAGHGTDVDFLKRSFHKLAMNFTWWVNRKDRFGKNLFEGGFLGLDNIGVFDRSAPLPTGGHLEQADGTAWMALFCQNMAELACELAVHDPSYEGMATKFLDHFLLIAGAMNRLGGGQAGLWDEEDGFYYDLLRTPDGRATPLKVRSMVGLLPLCAATVIEKHQRERLPNATRHVQERLARSPELRNRIHATGPGQFGAAERGMMALVDGSKLRRILARMLDEGEFLGPFGIRALSRHHLDHPFVMEVRRERYEVRYLPAESDTGMFGGNSNWRGPVWMPVNALIIRALLQYYLYYGDDFLVECPTGSGRRMNLFEVAREIADRLARIFLRGADGRRPVFGGAEKFQSDPHWRDHLLFYEYFHGDNGAGLGASHQTGWTGLVARLIWLFGFLDAKTYLQQGKGMLEQAPRPSGR